MSELLYNKMLATIPTTYSGYMTETPAQHRKTTTRTKTEGTGATESTSAALLASGPTSAHSSPNSRADSNATQVHTPAVSAIVPIYNVAIELPECLNSLVDQTLEDLQIILVDDGSTDESGTIAQEYAATYSNVEYHYIENQGLGYARNWGMQFAQGEYLCFPDSDDIIEPFAFEEMLELAHKHDADIVLCDADRFNTKRHWHSVLHVRAMRDLPEVTHISQSPQLFSDTTAWNKIYRRSFFLNSGITWAEGMLYEDIPATIPLHFLANKVAFLDKVGYHWRARDGASKSITQDRTDTTNFDDRVKAIRMVDEFFDAHVEDRDLHCEKDIKLLNNDFLIYLDVLPIAPPEFQQHVMDTLHDYLPRVDKRAFEHTYALDRIKYHYIEQGNLDGLMETYRFQGRGYEAIKITKRDGRFFGKFPLEGVTDSLCDMTKELAERDLRIRIRDAKLTEDTLSVDIRANIRMLNMNDVSMKADLVQLDGTPVAAFESHTTPAHIKHVIDISKDYRIVRRLNKAHRYFTLRLPLAELETLDEGTYRVLVSATVQGLECKPMVLANPSHSPWGRPLALLHNGCALWLDYDLSHCRFTLHIKRVSNYVQSIACENNVFYFACADGSVKEYDPSQDGTSLAIEHACFDPVPRYFALDAHTGMPKVNSLTTGENEERGATPSSSAPQSVTADNPGTTDFAKEDQSIASEEPQLWRAVANKDATLRISRINPGAVVTHVQLESNTYTLSIETPVELPVEVTHVVTRGRGHRGESRHELQATGNNTYVAHIHLDNGAEMANVRDDFCDIFVEGTTNIGKHLRFPLYVGLDRRQDLLEARCLGYRYWLDCRGMRTTLHVRRIKKAYERTELRRRLTEYLFYPLARKLPLKKNLAVFESYFCGSTDCNPGALLNYIEQHHPEYKCVWVLNDPRIAGGYGRNSVIPNTLPYYWTMARAQYFISNTDFPPSFRSRPNQIGIQTMHGTPLKTIGTDVEGWADTEERRQEFYEHNKQWNWITVQNEATETITRRCYGYTGPYLRTGYPRTDSLFAQNTPQRQAELKQQLGLPADKKLVLYAPTWRTGGRFDLHLDLAQLAESLGNEYVFALRRHPISLPGFTNRHRMGTTVRDFTYEPRADDVMLAADVLITDYSSIMFDYALLDRPIMFFVNDLETYRDELRGFNFDLVAEAPGPLLRSTNEVEAALANLDETVAQNQEAFNHFKETYLTFESGHSCEDVFRIAFEGKQE